MVIAFCVLLTAVISTAAVQSASAATKGTTIFTCKKGFLGFTKAHCKNGDAGTGEFGHVAVAENTTTEITSSNGTTGGEKEVTKLKATIAGIAFEIQSTSVTSHGSITNTKDASGEHYADGNIQITYGETTVASPAGKGCKVKGGAFNSLSVTITTTGQGDSVKIGTEGEKRDAGRCNNEIQPFRDHRTGHPHLARSESWA
jgi:hypothetical protein